MHCLACVSAGPRVVETRNRRYTGGVECLRRRLCIAWHNLFFTESLQLKIKKKKKLRVVHTPNLSPGCEMDPLTRSQVVITLVVKDSNPTSS